MSLHARRLAYLSTSCLALSLIAFAHAQEPLGKLRAQTPVAITHSALIGRPDPAQLLHITVTLTPPNEAALESFAKSVSDPSSAHYGEFLTPTQFGARFGQPVANVKRASDYLRSHGFKITLLGDNNLSISAEATVAQAEAAFHTSIKNYRSQNPAELGRKEYFSFSTPLSVPQDIAAMIGSVTGLSNQAKPIPRLRRSAKQSASTPLTPQQASVLYNTSALHSSNHWGQNRTIGISSFDGFDLKNVDLFYKQFNLPIPSVGDENNVKVETIQGGSQTLSPVGEADLDIQMVLSQAPLCKLVVYDGADDLIPVLTQEVQDNSVDIITESYGWAYDASQAESAHALHLQLTAQGITYFLASGDYGTEIDPSGGTYGDYDTELTNVGGTVANTTSTGARISEVGWTGSAGGWVTTPTPPFNTLPSWQKGTGVPTNINFRLIPDVALHSAGSNNDQTDPGAYQFFYEEAPSTDAGTFSGTSFASPVFAGSFALVEQQLIDKGILKAGLGGLARFGRINDLIYKQNGLSTVWHDITSGNNGLLPNGQQSNATKGWDFVTGWGSVDFNAWANSFSIPAPTVIAPSTAGIYNTFGQKATGGVAQLAAADGKYYSIGSVSSSIGPIASPYVIYTVPQAPASLSSLSLTLVENAPTGVSCQVYLYNYSTNLWNLENTSAMNGSSVKIVVSPWNFNQFVSPTGSFRAVVRAVNSNATAFTLNTDQAVLTATPQAP